MIEVRNIAGKGRGIVATQDIAEGCVIELAPTAVVPIEHREIVDKTAVSQYYFVRSSDYSGGKDVLSYLVFGLTSLCNHTDDPNSYVDWVEDELGIWARLLAKRNISAGEEVTMFYTNIDEYSNATKFV